ncbi:hypothetical protein BSLG_010852 [Batrachochytrium salamandrivorans]|nr:hypothetical protein BSLG_010852 [Batrachochytrium salamandrivorans]
MMSRLPLISSQLKLGSNDFKVFDSFTDPSGVTHVYGAYGQWCPYCQPPGMPVVRVARLISLIVLLGTASCQRDITVSTQSHSGLCKGVCYCFTQLGIPVDSGERSRVCQSSQMARSLCLQVPAALNPVTKWVEVWCDATTGKVIRPLILATRLARPSKSLVVMPMRVFNGINPELRGSSPNGWTAGRATGSNNVITLTPSDEPPQQLETGWKLPNKQLWQGAEEAMTLSLLMFLTLPMCNNADFLTPDGRPGVMNMYRFNSHRSAGFDNGVVIHEYAWYLQPSYWRAFHWWCLSTGSRGMAVQHPTFLSARNAIIALMHLQWCQQMRDHQGVCKRGLGAVPRRNDFSITSGC